MQDSRFEDEPVFFAQQVTELVNVHLTDEERLIFSHHTLALGYALLSISIARWHGLDRPAFNRMVDKMWKHHEQVVFSVKL